MHFNNGLYGLKSESPHLIRINLFTVGCIILNGGEYGGSKTDSGENLKKLWKIPAAQVRYHKDGTFFMPVDKFPAALCDPNGYVLFKTKAEYEKSSFLDIGTRVNVRNGIGKIPNYLKMK